MYVCIVGAFLCIAGEGQWHWILPAVGCVWTSDGNNRPRIYPNIRACETNQQRKSICFSRWGISFWRLLRPPLRPCVSRYPSSSIPLLLFLFPLPIFSDVELVPSLSAFWLQPLFFDPTPPLPLPPFLFKSSPAAIEKALHALRRPSKESLCSCSQAANQHLFEFYLSKKGFLVIPDSPRERGLLLPN